MKPYNAMKEGFCSVLGKHSIIWNIFEFSRKLIVSEN